MQLPFFPFCFLLNQWKEGQHVENKYCISFVIVCHIVRMLTTRKSPLFKIKNAHVKDLGL